MADLAAWIATRRRPLPVTAAVLVFLLLMTNLLAVAVPPPPEPDAEAVLACMERSSQVRQQRLPSNRNWRLYGAGSAFQHMRPSAAVEIL